MHTVHSFTIAAEAQLLARDSRIQMFVLLFRPQNILVLSRALFVSKYQAIAFRLVHSPTRHLFLKKQERQFTYLQHFVFTIARHTCNDSSLIFYKLTWKVKYSEHCNESNTVNWLQK